MSFSSLYLILGDQLNRKHSWFRKIDQNRTFLFIESREEATYVAHHIQKIIGFFAAMRNFAKELQEQGHQVRYLFLSDAENRESIKATIKSLIEAHRYEAFHYQYPDEYRLDLALSSLTEELEIPVYATDTEHFLTQRTDFSTFFKGKKSYLMESFYRSMRKKYDILMVNGEPEGGKWNYDHSNRAVWNKDFKPAPPLLFSHDVRGIADELKEAGIHGIGHIDTSQFIWPVRREEGLQLLDHFLRHHLKEFGTYQDVMDDGNNFLNHSRISFLLNTKILDPLEVCEATLSYWRAHHEEITIAQVEGFLRQIIGWREYMRGVYWAHMPDYSSLNYFNHTRKLPEWYWTGKTKMNCLQTCINNSLDKAYAHHIQRLMVTGNFAVLAGIHPDEIDKWYLGIYIDAIEWVEITNTRGMSQYADGGMVGTKPYVSSANYISKMSNYCGSCYYDKNQKTGPKACPFNSLYWHFYEQNRDKLEKNPRIGFVYRTLDKMNPGKKEELMNQAEKYLSQLESL
jgi:deoxyribodipyrimidine photolyase-related protein